MSVFDVKYSPYSSVVSRCNEVYCSFVAEFDKALMKLKIVDDKGPDFLCSTIDLNSVLCSRLTNGIGYHEDTY